MRGLTFLLDEFRTSQQCPCGAGELKNGTNHLCPSHPDEWQTRIRVRVHKTTGDECEVLRQQRDRDELATNNMLQAALAATRRKAWPKHLDRNYR